MSGVHDAYTREMYDKFGYFACWLPSTRLTLGDVGTIEDRRFGRRTTLDDLGVSYSVGEPSVVGNLEYATSGAVDVEVSGEAGPLAQLSITFTSRGATYFQAAGCATATVSDLAALERKLSNLPEWQSDYVVVTELVHTGPAVILVSSEKGAAIEVGLPSTALSELAPIASAGAQWAMTSKSGLAARLVVSDGATPLFRAMRLRRPVVGKPRLRWRSGGTDPIPAANAPALTPVTWDEFAGDS